MDLFVLWRPVAVQCSSSWTIEVQFEHEEDNTLLRHGKIFFAIDIFCCCWSQVWKGADLIQDPAWEEMIFLQLLKATALKPSLPVQLASFQRIRSYYLWAYLIKQCTISDVVRDIKTMAALSRSMYQSPIYTCPPAESWRVWECESVIMWKCDTVKEW